jgi:cytochrome c oxidase subunit 1
MIYSKNRGFSFPLHYWAFSIGAIFAVFAAIYYWFPILFSRSLGIWTSQLHFWLSALAVFGFLLLAPGLEALIAPRDTALSNQRAMMVVLGTAIISIILFLVAQIIFLAGFLWSAIYGQKT